MLTAKRREPSLTVAKLAPDEVVFGFQLYDVEFAALASIIDTKLQRVHTLSHALSLSLSLALSLSLLRALSSFSSLSVSFSLSLRFRVRGACLHYRHLIAAGTHTLSISRSL